MTKNAVIAKLIELGADPDLQGAGAFTRDVAAYLKKGDREMARIVAYNGSANLMPFARLRRFIHENIVLVGWWDNQSHRMTRT